MRMNKRLVLRNLLLALASVAFTLVFTLAAYYYIAAFMAVPR